jgi:hypothetical protein
MPAGRAIPFASRTAKDRSIAVAMLSTLSDSASDGRIHRSAVTTPRMIGATWRDGNRSRSAAE